MSYGIFAFTGSIDAYLLYKDCLCDENQELGEAGAEPI